MVKPSEKCCFYILCGFLAYHVFYVLTVKNDKKSTALNVRNFILEQINKVLKLDHLIKISQQHQLNNYQ